MVPLPHNGIIKKIKRLQKTCKEIGYIQFIINLFYKSHEEILAWGDLNKRTEFSFRNNLTLQSIEKKHQDILLNFYRESNSSDLYPGSRIDNYFANDFKCFIAKRENKIIGHVWWGDNRSTYVKCDPSLRYIGETFGLKEGDVLAIDFFIVPEERGGGTAIDCFYNTLISLNELGHNRLFGLVQPNNRGARWTYKLLGFIDIKKIVVHRILNYIVLIDRKIYLSPPFYSW
jgi:hypothetical protein